MCLKHHDDLCSSFLQPYATASYGQHSLLATVNVLRSVIAAAAQVRYTI